MPDGFIVDMPQPADTDPAYRTTTDIPLPAWAEPDFRLWLALHLPDGHLADMIDDHGNRTGIVIYTAAGRATADYTTGDTGAWPVTQDTTRLWNTVQAAWTTWQHHRQPARHRIGVTAHTNGDQHAWLDRPEGPIRWPIHGRAETS